MCYQYFSSHCCYYPRSILSYLCCLINDSYKRITFCVCIRFLLIGLVPHLENCAIAKILSRKILICFYVYECWDTFLTCCCHHTRLKNCKNIYIDVGIEPSLGLIDSPSCLAEKQTTKWLQLTSTASQRMAGHRDPLS